MAVNLRQQPQPQPNMADRAASWLSKTFGSSGRGTGRAPWDLGTPLATGMHTKADPAGSLIVSSYGLAQPVRTPRRFDKLADEGYNQNPIVHRAINLIATAIAGIPWRLYEKGNRSGTLIGGTTAPTTTPSRRRGMEIETHPLLDLMARPNPTQGWGKFIEAYVAYLYVAGNSYLWANRANGGKGAPVELWTMRPDRMRIVPDEKQFVAGYTYEVNGKHVDFAAPDVLHTKMFAPLDDWYGMSPLVVAARAIDVRNAGGDWNLALVQQSGRVPGFFTVKDRLGDTQFERMREQFIDRYTGRRNVGLPGLLDGGDIGWLEAGKTPLDMDWNNLSTEMARDIALTIGVPPELLGDSKIKTYSNYAEARASFYEETVLPLADITRDELNRWLVPMYGGAIALDYDHEDIEAVQEQRGRLYQYVGKFATFLTINEQRAILGYPPRPEGDVIIVPLTTADLETVAEGQQVHLTPPSVPLGGGALPGAPGGARPNDASDTDEGAPTPAPDAGAEGPKPGESGVPDGGMAGGVDANAPKARTAAYDPLDDLLAGKVIRFRPKAAPPAPERTGRRLAGTARR